MSSRRPKPEHKESLREEILDAARELFVAEGYESVSMRKIAERIGYSPTTIYLYFKDKSELLRQICESTFERLADEIVESQSKATGPLDKLRRGLLTYINFGLKNPHHYDVVFVSPKVRFMGPTEYSFDGSMGQRAFELLGSSVAECMAAGVLRKGDVALTAQTFWAGIHGVTSLVNTHDGFPFVESERLATSIVDTMIAGLES
jgi:AcrR family transcriptional regulator